MARNAAHQALRSGTRAAHERLDGLFAGFDLADRARYAAFLSAHAAALLPLEAALDAAGAEAITSDWPARRRGEMLRADLAELGAAVPAPERFASDLDDPAAVAGALYVVEGSRLGGRFLARQLASDAPRRYLDPGQAPENWPILLDRIDALLYSDTQQERAIATALDVFAAFEKAGRRWL